ncbi:MAG: hypothetical protein LBF86_08465 [Helicobacteraceae bacterium]|nr:hypothetical protein [Helicobacteraceae bacterium]
MKLIGLIASCLIAFFVVGCDSQSGEEADMYDRQKSLDDGDYARVLELTSNCGGDQPCLMDRAAAYMGLAGFDAPSIVKAITNEEDDKGYFAILSPSIRGGDANASLGKATTTYTSVLATRGYNVNNCDSSVGVLNKYEKDSCVNYGLAAIGRSAVLADKVLKLYESLSSSCDTIDACFGAAGNKDVVNGLLADAVDLIFNDSDAIVDMISKGDSDAKEKIGEIKQDICNQQSINPCNAAGVTSNLDAIFKYILEKR